MLEERIANKIAQSIQCLVFDDASSRWRHRVDWSALPYFKICLKTTVMIHRDHLAEEVDPDSMLRGISLFPIESDDQPAVLVGGFDQRNARHRLFLDTYVDGRVIDRNFEQVVIATCRRAIGLPTVGQRIDKLLGQHLRARDADTHSGSGKADLLKIIGPPGSVLPVCPPSFGVERQRQEI